MEQIDFHFGVANRTVYVAKLIKKVQKMGLSVAVWGRDDILMKRAYDDLWRFEDLTFIAHCWVGDAHEADCTVRFGKDLTKLPTSDVLVLLDEEVPADWQNALKRFKRVVDIVSQRETELQNARNRYRIYLRSAGVVLRAFDRSKS